MKLRSHFFLTFMQRGGSFMWEVAFCRLIDAETETWDCNITAHVLNWATLGCEVEIDSGSGIDAVKPHARVYADGFVWDAEKASMVFA